MSAFEPIEDKSKVKQLLTEAVTLLCRSSLKFSTEVNVEGLLGITLDQSDIFLVSIKETIKKEFEATLFTEDESHSEIEYPVGRKRKRRKPCRSPANPDESNDDDIASKKIRDSYEPKKDCNGKNRLGEMTTAGNDLVYTPPLATMTRIPENIYPNSMDHTEPNVGDERAIPDLNSNTMIIKQEVLSDTECNDSEKTSMFDKNQADNYDPSSFDNSTGCLDGQEVSFAGTFVMPTAASTPENQTGLPKINKVGGSGSGTLKCNLCDKQCDQRHNMVTHIKEVHFNHRRFLCAGCGESFQRAGLLKKHMVRVHSEQPEGSELYQCAICMKKFSDQEDLTKHTRKSHRNFLNYDELLTKSMIEDDSVLNESSLTEANPDDVLKEQNNNDITPNDLALVSNAEQADLSQLKKNKGHEKIEVKSAKDDHLINDQFLVDPANDKNKSCAADPVTMNVVTSATRTRKTSAKKATKPGQGTTAPAAQKIPQNNKLTLESSSTSTGKKQATPVSNTTAVKKRSTPVSKATSVKKQSTPFSKSKAAKKQTTSVARSITPKPKKQATLVSTIQDSNTKKREVPKEKKQT